MTNKMPMPRKAVAVPDGSVIVPRAEWERVNAAAARAESFDEDAADLRAGKRALARIEAGESEFFPLELVKRISNGESPVRVFREHRGISGAELGRRVGLDQSTISNIETGKTHGTLATTVRIARALGVDLANLVPADLADD